MRDVVNEQEGLEPNSPEINGAGEVINESQGEAQVSGEIVSNEESVEKTEYELPKGVQKRFKVLTQRTKETQARLDQALAVIQSLQQKPVNLEEMSDSEIVDHKVQLALAKQREEQIRQHQYQIEAEKRQAQVSAQVNDYATWIPDIKEVLEDAAEMVLPNDAVSFIRSSDIGPLLAYHLEKDEALQDKVHALVNDPKALERYLLKLELKLEAEMEAKKSSTKSQTKASAPVGSPTKGSKSTSGVVDVSQLSIADYRVWKAEQSRKR